MAFKIKSNSNQTTQVQNYKHQNVNVSVGADGGDIRIIGAQILANFAHVHVANIE